jgi:ribosomal protein S2
MADINLAQLLEAGVHFGHKAYRWNCASHYTYLKCVTI